MAASRSPTSSKRGAGSVAAAAVQEPPHPFSTHAGPMGRVRRRGAAGPPLPGAAAAGTLLGSAGVAGQAPAQSPTGSGRLAPAMSLPAASRPGRACAAGAGRGAAGCGCGGAQQASRRWAAPAAAAATAGRALQTGAARARTVAAAAAAATAAAAAEACTAAAAEGLATPPQLRGRRCSAAAGAARAGGWAAAVARRCSWLRRRAATRPGWGGCCRCCWRLRRRRPRSQPQHPQWWRAVVQAQAGRAQRAQAQGGQQGQGCPPAHPPCIGAGCCTACMCMRACSPCAPVAVGEQLTSVSTSPLLCAKSTSAKPSPRPTAWKS
jgi:hypothetical protein